jgi:hypothetical protein
MRASSAGHPARTSADRTTASARCGNQSLAPAGLARDSNDGRTSAACSPCRLCLARTWRRVARPGRAWCRRATQCSHPCADGGGDWHDDTGGDDTGHPRPRRTRAFSRSRNGADLCACDLRGDHPRHGRICHCVDHAASHHFGLSLDIRFYNLRNRLRANACPPATLAVSTRHNWLSRTRGSASCRTTTFLARITGAIREPASLPNLLARIWNHARVQSASSRQDSVPC